LLLIASMYTILKCVLLVSLFTLAWSVEIDAQRPCACEREAVLLSDIKVLELRQGEFTTSGRLPAIPQVECVGGSAKGYKQPMSVRCVNVGRAGMRQEAPHWRCEAKLDNEVQLGQVTITCEGYSAPHDPYVLRGSCGLKYTLEYKHWSSYILGYCGRLVDAIVFTPLKWLFYLFVIAVVSLFGLSLIRPSNKKRGTFKRKREEDEELEEDEEIEEDYEENESDEEMDEMITEEITWKERLRPRGVASPAPTAQGSAER